MIAILDYGVGNIKAFANLYRRLNMEYKIVSTPEQFAGFTKIILPGVGSFDHAMAKLQSSGFREALDYFVLEKKVPVIGVCVGMQMLADSSEEGSLPGLGWIKAQVKKFNFKQNNIPLPHMGWNEVQLKKENKLLTGLKDRSRFYFLHSYYFDCADKDLILATSDYYVPFDCIVHKENIYGIQCHPEKSHQNGITVLENFGAM